MANSEENLKYNLSVLKTKLNKIIENENKQKIGGEINDTTEERRKNFNISDTFRVLSGFKVLNT